MGKRKEKKIEVSSWELAAASAVFFVLAWATDFNFLRGVALFFGWVSVVVDLVAFFILLSIKTSALKKVVRNGGNFGGPKFVIQLAKHFLVFFVIYLFDYKLSVALWVLYAVNILAAKRVLMATEKNEEMGRE